MKEVTTGKETAKPSSRVLDEAERLKADITDLMNKYLARHPEILKEFESMLERAERVIAHEKAKMIDAERNRPQ